jgi:hypothetical protein
MATSPNAPKLASTITPQKGVLSMGKDWERDRKREVTKGVLR